MAACWFNSQPSFSSSSGFFHPDRLFTSLLSSSSLSGGAPKHIIIIIKVFVCIRIVRMEISAQANPLDRSWMLLNITSHHWIMTLHSVHSMALKPKSASGWRLEDCTNQKSWKNVNYMYDSSWSIYDFSINSHADRKNEDVIKWKTSCSSNLVLDAVK